MYIEILYKTDILLFRKKIFDSIESLFLYAERERENDRR